MKTKIVLVIVFLLIATIAIQRNAIRNLTLENEKLAGEINKPVLINKPSVIIKWKERVVRSTDTVEPITLILEREVEVERQGGTDIKTVVREVPVDNSVVRNWTAGVSYNGEMGGLVTRRIYKTLEAGVECTNKKAGVLGTVKF